MIKKITIKKDKRTKLEKEIDSVLESMAMLSADSKEYTAMMDNLEKLYKVKVNERTHKIKPDTVIMVAGNLLGIGIILWHEKADVITSKALGFVLKGRV